MSATVPVIFPALPDLRRAQDGAVLTLTLDRPDARNAYSDAMVDSLVRALDDAERDDAVRCVILTGAGPAFSRRRRPQAHAAARRHVRRRTRRAAPPLHRRHPADPAAPRAAEKPVVAAINGPAIGAGLDLACMCDLRLAARGAQLGSTFVKVGLVPGDGGAYFLSRTVGFPARSS
jgi:2-(1,2-epoxy-1,2-dihydrophenyl)acetyl-CoA isomerase